MHENTGKVKTVARVAGVTSVLLTGKGEPFKNYDDVLFFSESFKEYPLEIQTNGIWLSKSIGEIKTLRNHGVNLIAISVDSAEQSDSVKIISKAAHSNGMLVRVTFNITNMFRWASRCESNRANFEEIIQWCLRLSVDQMTLRNIVSPNHTKETKQSLWIKKNVDPEYYARLKQEMEIACKYGGFFVRSLPYGAKIYDYKGISVSHSDYCIQDSSNGDDLRSLIFMEDGHLYTNWNSKASVLF